MIYYASNPKETMAGATDSRTVTLYTDLLPLVKSHGRITVATDDALVTMYIRSAILTIEQHLDMAVAPAAYDWDIPEEDKIYDKYALPIRNCTLAGSTIAAFTIDKVASQQFMDPPVSWPVKLEVGFATVAAVPADLLTAICQLATTLYEARTTPELAGAFLPEYVRNQLARYIVPRC